jgi:hypothetical protein
MGGRPGGYLMARAVKVVSDMDAHDIDFRLRHWRLCNANSLCILDRHANGCFLDNGKIALIPILVLKKATTIMAITFTKVTTKYNY